MNKAEEEAERLLDYIRDHLEDYYGDNNKLYDKTHLINKISKTLNEVSREVALGFTNWHLPADMKKETELLFDIWIKETTMKCRICGEKLKPAPAKFGGELTYVGYLPCEC